MSTATQKNPALHDPRWVCCSDRKPKLSVDGPAWIDASDSYPTKILLFLHEEYLNEACWNPKTRWISAAVAATPIPLVDFKPVAPAWVWDNNADRWSFFCEVSDGLSWHPDWTHWLPGDETQKPVSKPGPFARKCPGVWTGETSIHPLKPVATVTNAGQTVLLLPGYRGLVTGEEILATDLYWDEVKWVRRSEGVYGKEYVGDRYDYRHKPTIRALVPVSEQLQPEIGRLFPTCLFIANDAIRPGDFSLFSDAEVQGLKNQISALQGKVDRQTTALRELNERQISLTEQLDGKQGCIRAQLTEVESLRTRAENAEENATATHEHLTRLSDKLKAAEAQGLAARQTITTLNKNFDDRRNEWCNRFSVTEAATVEANRQLEEAKQEVRDVRRMLAECRDRCENLEGAADQNESVVMAVYGLNSSLASEVTELRDFKAQILKALGGEEYHDRSLIDRVEEIIADRKRLYRAQATSAVIFQTEADLHAEIRSALPTEFLQFQRNKEDVLWLVKTLGEYWLTQRKSILSQAEQLLALHDLQKFKDQVTEALTHDPLQYTNQHPRTQIAELILRNGNQKQHILKVPALLGRSNNISLEDLENAVKAVVQARDAQGERIQTLETQQKSWHDLWTAARVLVDSPCRDSFLGRTAESGFLNALALCTMNIATVWGNEQVPLGGKEP